MTYTNADLKAKDTDHLVEEALDMTRALSSLFRTSTDQHRSLRELGRFIRELAKRTVEEESVDLLWLAPKEASAVWSDIAAINLMLGIDGWEESDDPDGPDGAELAKAIHDIGASMLTAGVDQALGTKIWNQVLWLGDKLDRTLHGRTPNEMQQGLQAKPLSMEELHSVLQAANEAASALVLLRVENNRLRARNAKLKQQRLATRKYLGRIMKQVSP